MKDYARIAAAVRKDACEDYPEKCHGCGARNNCGSRRIHWAADAIDELLQLHSLDQSEIVLLRRQIQVMMEGRGPVEASWVNLIPPEDREAEKSVYWMCSKCKRAALFIAEDLPYRFCPNCGAIMKGEYDHA